MTRGNKIKSTVNDLDSQEICTRLLQMPAEQSSIPKEGRRTTPIGNTSRTMARDQHRYHQTFTKVKRDGCYSGYCQLIYENDLSEGNNDEYLVGRNSKDL